MKNSKIFKGMAFVFGSLLLVGCGDTESTEVKKDEKKEDVKLVCSMEEEGQKMSYVFTFDHTKENMKSGQMLMELEIPEESSSELEDLDMCEFFTSSEEEESKVFKECKSTKTDTTYTMTIDLDLDEMEKLSEEDEDEPFRKDMTLKEVQDSIEKSEEQNLVCETK